MFYLPQQAHTGIESCFSKTLFSWFKSRIILLLLTAPFTYNTSPILWHRFIPLICVCHDSSSQVKRGCTIAHNHHLSVQWTLSSAAIQTDPDTLLQIRGWSCSSCSSMRLLSVAFNASVMQMVLILDMINLSATVLTSFSFIFLFSTLSINCYPKVKKKLKGFLLFLLPFVIKFGLSF